MSQLICVPHPFIFHDGRNMASTIYLPIQNEILFSFILLFRGIQPFSSSEASASDSSWKPQLFLESFFSCFKEDLVGPVPTVCLEPVLQVHYLSQIRLESIISCLGSDFLGPVSCSLH